MNHANLRITLPICDQCRREAGLPPRSRMTTPALCPVSGRPIGEHGTSGTCPKRLFTLPRQRKDGPRPSPSERVGTELHAMLAKIGFGDEPGCGCGRKAEMMDRMGADWCEANVDAIVDWLRDEHRRRRRLLPFIPAAARLLVRRAIRRARRKAAAAAAAAANG